VGIVLTMIGFTLVRFGIPSPTVLIVKAHLEASKSGHSLGFVRMRKHDVLKIVDREYYIRAKIFSCKKEADFFPLDLSYAGVRLDEFSSMHNKLVENPSKNIDLSFSLPDAIAKSYADQCLRIDGGQMVGIGSVSSNVIKIM
jgi:hypothetical protein